MKLHIAWIQARRGKEKSSGIQSLAADFRERLGHYIPIETHECADEPEMLRAFAKASGARLLVALDSRGKQMTSEDFAGLLSTHQDRGTRHLFFAIGGADGFSPAFLRNAGLQLSFGKMTLPHGLARVVLLEQLYRAFTILKGHPYHTGH